MPRQSTANVDMGQQLSLTNYDNLEEFLPTFVVVKVNSAKNYQLNM